MRWVLSVSVCVCVCVCGHTTTAFRPELVSRLLVWVSTRSPKMCDHITSDLLRHLGRDMLRPGKYKQCTHFLASIMGIKDGLQVRAGSSSLVRAHAPVSPR